MKDPKSALFLRVFLPGAGLAYLVKWAWVFFNLGVVLSIYFAAAWLLPDETFKSYFLYISVVCSVGSGLLVHVVAKRLNENSRSDCAV